ncbi:MAG: spermidine/putrescine ABC transporter substrate-binding protein PotF [Lysobacteraceae bacterium]|nr:MAG: spermidine/putrescine ABC transporter substrate-binding protein PotF [Xanthomonadaceae bacterium]
MKLKMTVLVAALLAAACSKEPAPDAGADAAPAPAPSKVLNIYNWSDYIAEDTIANFEKETGIKVTYDVFDSNEVLEAKLLAGNTGYDIVVPSLTFLSRQIQAGVFQPLDKSRFTQYGNLDPEMMAMLAKNDTDNAHSVPYLWGTTGIGYNVAKVKAALGDDFPLDSWAMVFEPENLAKLKGCGVAILDTPSEIIPPMLGYLGEEPNSFDPAVIQKAVDRLTLLRPSITYFHSSQYINDLANGDICVAIGWSGDIIQAQARAAEADKGVEVSYIIPKQGAPMWFDMLAIPKGAKNIDNAYLFIDYLMRPDVMAGVQNYVAYASANQAALPMVDKAILDDPGIYPTPEARKGLYTLAVLPPEVDRLFTRHWTTLKTGK